MIVYRPTVRRRRRLVDDFYCVKQLHLCDAHPPRKQKNIQPQMKKRKIKGRRAVSATPNKIKSSDAAVCVKTLNEKQIGPEQKLRCRSMDRSAARLYSSPSIVEKSEGARKIQKPTSKTPTQDGNLFFFNAPDIVLK